MTCAHLGKRLADVESLARRAEIGDSQRASSLSIARRSTVSASRVGGCHGDRDNLLPRPNQTQSTGAGELHGVPRAADAAGLWSPCWRFGRRSGHGRRCGGGAGEDTAHEVGRGKDHHEQSEGSGPRRRTRYRPREAKATTRTASRRPLGRPRHPAAARETSACPRGAFLLTSVLAVRRTFDD